MTENKFEKEYLLVENALKDSEGEKLLKAYLKDLINSIVDVYAKTEKAKNLNRTDLYNAALTHLQLAMRNYMKRANEMKNNKNAVYHFSTYFTWYARQGIIDYLNLEDSGNDT